MTEERQVDSTADTGEPTADAVVSSGGQTVEEVEAFWRNRQSGTDRAHNAETASLRAQLEAATKPPSQAPAGESPEAERIRVLEAERDAAVAQAARESRARQYPYAASILGDEVANVSVEKLAAIEGAGDGGSTSLMDPNAARRGQSGVQVQADRPLAEKSKDELLADLRRAEPMIRAEAAEGITR